MGNVTIFVIENVNFASHVFYGSYLNRQILCLKMTRLAVKNLPKNISKDEIKTYFGQKGTVTDIQLKYTKEGVFRQFAFIGYQTDDEASEAIKFFNNSYIRTSKIKVEECVSINDPQKPRPWSKYSEDSSAFKQECGSDTVEPIEDKNFGKKPKENQLNKLLGEHKQDPEFIEFLKVTDKNRLLWDNDSGLKNTENVSTDTKDTTKNEKKEDGAICIVQKDLGETGVPIEKQDDCEEETSDDQIEKIANKNISDTEYKKSLVAKKATDGRCSKPESKSNLIDLFTIKIHGIPFKVKRQEIIKFFKPTKPYSVRLPTKVHGFCYVGFKTEKEFKKGMLKNKSFLKGKQVFFSDFTEKNKISRGESLSKESDGSQKNKKWAKQEAVGENDEDISESGRIFFRNLAYSTTENELRELFEKFGPVAEINLPVDPITLQIKGFGTVAYVMPEHAVMAFNALDGSSLHGRLLHLIPGKSTDNDEDGQDDLNNLSYKAKKASKLKKSSQHSYNWNTLFLDSTAVVDILAKRLGESKETILDSRQKGSNAATRLALGETQIVAEIKKFLEENGVHLDSFNAECKRRSNTVILVKNLPAETSVTDLKPLFSKYGTLGRIILPPSGVTAIVEFNASCEARQAFKNLAYTKFKNVPLYLEWAPADTFKTPANELLQTNETSDAKSNLEGHEKEPKEDISHTLAADKENDYCKDDPPEPETTLFLHNLNFKTREEAIQEHFKHLGHIHIVQVARKRDPEDHRRMISLGYGFIQFKRKESAIRALKEMHFTSIEGNQVELKRSDRTLKVEVKHSRKPAPGSVQTGTKIVVRNVPFQAKVKEIREIFQAFGNIKSVRLPKKSTTGEEQHRGFGFVDFFDKNSAKEAFDALSSSTHLYGRRLVLEWAKDTDAEVEEIRKRTAQTFETLHTNSKRFKSSVFDSSKVDEIDESSQ